ncbi:type II toxin-antitoxin system Phd/YefM family antitoxin [Nocardioides sp. Bht2]|uniref:type II toxin-antitoxin system Phd/YefM family antitoxin n=1 Tax=Nocardioides sp. Bht2 TaxID=3392297 RepID=UPI0039B422ED
MSTVSARTFNQSPSKVKALAQDGPVFITERGRAMAVLMSIDTYEELTGHASVRDSLRMDIATDTDVDFEPIVARDLGRVAELWPICSTRTSSANCARQTPTTVLPPGRRRSGGATHSSAS